MVSFSSFKHLTSFCFFLLLLLHTSCCCSCIVQRAHPMISSGASPKRPNPILILLSVPRKKGEEEKESFFQLLLACLDDSELWLSVCEERNCRKIPRHVLRRKKENLLLKLQLLFLLHFTFIGFNSSRQPPTPLRLVFNFLKSGG